MEAPKRGFGIFRHVRKGVNAQLHLQVKTLSKGTAFILTFGKINKGTTSGMVSDSSEGCSETSGMASDSLEGYPETSGMCAEDSALLPLLI